MDAGNSMAPRSGYVSALGAFWPAMQVLYGDIDGAQITFQCTCFPSSERPRYTD
jgi:hypothetical protein